MPDERTEQAGNARRRIAGTGAYEPTLREPASVRPPEAEDPSQRPEQEGPAPGRPRAATLGGVQTRAANARPSGRGAVAGAPVGVDAAKRARNRLVVGAFALAAACMLVALAVLGPAQLAPDASVDDEASSDEPVVSASEEASFDPTTAWLPADMEPQLSQTLRAAAVDDVDVRYAVRRAADYGRFGAEYQTQLLELAAEEPPARPFVAQVLDAYPTPASGGLDASDLPEGTVVPRLYQWDVRWGFMDYSSGPLGLTGCCPTSLSMVYTGLTGRTDRSPADMAQLAIDRGFVSESEGTFAEFLPAVAPELGLSCAELRITARSITDALSQGQLLICNVGKGDFTDAGHFLVITGIAEDGTVWINDPYSSANSSVSWDPQRLADQAIGLYAFRAAS